MPPNSQYLESLDCNGVKELICGINVSRLVAYRETTASDVDALSLYQRDDWYRARVFTQKLDVHRQKNIRDARKRLQDRGRKVDSGRIVSELTFQFWVALHERKYRDQFWIRFLRKIWPDGEDVRKLHKDLLKIRDLRNRIAHHEPVFWEFIYIATHENQMKTITYDFQSFINLRASLFAISSTSLQSMSLSSVLSLSSFLPSSTVLSSSVIFMPSFDNLILDHPLKLVNGWSICARPVSAQVILTLPILNIEFPFPKSEVHGLSVRFRKRIIIISKLEQIIKLVDALYKLADASYKLLDVLSKVWNRFQTHRREHRSHQTAMA